MIDISPTPSLNKVGISIHLDLINAKVPYNCLAGSCDKKNMTCSCHGFFFGNRDILHLQISLSSDTISLTRAIEQQHNYPICIIPYRLIDIAIFLISKALTLKNFFRIYDCIQKILNKKLIQL